jgi:hypothetical protein
MYEGLKVKRAWHPMAGVEKPTVSIIANSYITWVVKHSSTRTVELLHWETEFPNEVNWLRGVSQCHIVTK